MKIKLSELRKLIRESVLAEALSVHDHIESLIDTVESSDVKGKVYLSEFWGKKKDKKESPEIDKFSDPLGAADKAMSSVVSALWGPWDDAPHPDLLKKAQDLHAEILDKIKEPTIKSIKELQEIIREQIKIIQEDANPAELDSERFPLKLSAAAADVADAQKDAKAGKDNVDKGSADDVIGVNSASFSVQQLKPSQSSMNIEKALSMALGMIQNDSPGGDLGAFISSDNHIMDGHHRWVATAMVDPSAKIGGFRVDWPATELLAVLNTITVGKFGVTSGKPATGGFDQFQEAPIRNQLEKYLENGAWKMTPEHVQSVIEKFTGQTGDVAKDVAVKKFVENLATASFELPAGAPSREDMPVIDGGDVKAAAAALTRGEIDVNPPYGHEIEKQSNGTNEPVDTKNGVFTERWNKLAGLIK